jgi:serine/threonine protein kinase
MRWIVAHRPVCGLHAQSSLSLLPRRCLLCVLVKTHGCRACCPSLGEITLECCAGSTGPTVPGIIYRPPEVLQATEGAGAPLPCHPAVDIWAFGVIAFELLTNSPAFAHGSTRKAIGDQISGRKGGLPWESAWGPGLEGRLVPLRGLRGLVLRCLSRDPSARPSARDVVAGVSTELKLS